jgi:hypothetical protein
MRCHHRRQGGQAESRIEKERHADADGARRRREIGRKGRGDVEGSVAACGKDGKDA